jgi:Zn-dependent protease
MVESTPGIIITLLISTIAYISNFGYFAKIATLYAFFSLLPISKFDGTQIFFGSRVLYAVLVTITLIYTYYALII